jgi:hypothetical protein
MFMPPTTDPSGQAIQITINPIIWAKGDLSQQSRAPESDVPGQDA